MPDVTEPAVWPQKFIVGDCVVIVRCFRAASYIGVKSEIEECFQNPPNWKAYAYDYRLTNGLFVHEDEIDEDKPAQVMKRLRS